MTDLAFSVDGTVGMCTVLSKAGEEWVAANVATERWQWAGNSFAVEPRYAIDLIEGARADGLECET